MSREVAIIQLMLTPGVGARSMARLLMRLRSERYAVEDFAAAPLTELMYEFGLPQMAAEAMIGAQEEAMALAGTLAEHGVEMVTLADEGYPSQLTQRLGRMAPPVLFVRGDTRLMEKPMVGFSGVREGSEEGLALAQEIASALARDGVNVVSGYAPGIDTAAHFGAVSAGGVTTAVLASGILHFSARGGLGAFCDETNLLVVSEFFPTMPWKSHSAMQRNKTIGGLVRSMVIVESGAAGGTFAAGTTALEIGCPLYVIDWGESLPCAAGNAELIRRGGRAVTPDSWLKGLEPLWADAPAELGQPNLFE